MTGLCDAERKKLMDCGKLVNQIFKAAKAINENVLLEMPVPALIKGALPKASNLCATSHGVYCSFLANLLLSLLTVC